MVPGARGKHRPGPGGKIPARQSRHIIHPPVQAGAEHPAPVLQTAQRHGVAQRQLQPQLLLCLRIPPQVHLQARPDLEQRLQPWHARANPRRGATHRRRGGHAHIQLVAVAVPQIGTDSAPVHPQMRRTVNKDRKRQQILALPVRPAIIGQRDGRQPQPQLPHGQTVAMGQCAGIRAARLRSALK